jgi:hypothetical protein
MPARYLDKLNDPVVRDLAWVIGAPGLVDAKHPAYLNRVVGDAWCSAQLHSCESWLTMLDNDPHQLHNYIATHPTRRLGHYFESLINYWLTHLSDTQIIATNLQIQEPQRTLGEYDFLFKDASSIVHHWEVAVKFYLQQLPQSEQHAFIGPGTRDRLDIKLDRIFQHQLLLSLTPAGQHALPNGIRLDMTQAFVKGYLFYHSSSHIRPGITGISKNHLYGWWVRHKLDAIPKISGASRWIIPSRLRWLSPALLEKNAEVLTYFNLVSKLDAHFKVSTDSLLIFEMTQEINGTWLEQSRGFVVHQTWPIIDTPIKEKFQDNS